MCAPPAGIQAQTWNVLIAEGFTERTANSFGEKIKKKSMMSHFYIDISVKLRAC